MPQTLNDRVLAAYLGFACGDALGATVEFMRPKQIQQRYGVHKDIIGGGWLGLTAGEVTDDTQMTLALGQAVLEQGRWDIKAIADQFIQWLDTNPPDVGNTVRRGLLRYRTTGELFTTPNEKDAGNGACMRNLPVVLLTLQQQHTFHEWSLQQCHLTHNHPLSDAATLALGAMLRHLLLAEDGVARCQFEANRLLHIHPEFSYTPYPGKASAYIVDTIQTVLHYFFSTHSFEECVVATVNQGDDADTTGALAGMLAGAYYGLEHIPKRWLNQLDKNIVTQIRHQSIALRQINKLQA
ncbi:ADP-ribosyl-[dinitrogen reductase] hydrolase [Methylomonas sp. AM2-LC]|uniref:ADP-ribosyl-[dinitrogen reductase] hydrolase n=1 Tax=Methylomonas sp. AM2-LC TaxID=3153301 RepID=UPI003263AA30